MPLQIKSPPSLMPGEPRQNHASENALQPSSEVRILILDDDLQICDLVRRLFSERNFQIDAVSHADQVEAQLRSQPYHLLLLDYFIDKLPPERVLEWIQKYQPEASVIVVTAHPSQEGILQCLRAHTFDYITKPFSLDLLESTVLRCLEGKGLLRMTEDALRESLGLAIRERRKALGFTLAQLADRTKISLGYLSQIELGKNSASIETLYKISLGLEIKLSDLFDSVQKKD